MSKNALDGSAVPDRLAHHIELPVGRHRDIQNLNGGIPQHVRERVVDLRDASQIGNFSGDFRGTRGDCDNIEPRVGVCLQLDIAHDEPGADGTDSEIRTRRPGSEVLEI